MESDAYLEFKWKGDKFFIYIFFLPCSICIDSLSDSAAASSFQMDNGDRQVSLKWKKERGKPSAPQPGPHDTNSGRKRIYSAFALRE